MYKVMNCAKISKKSGMWINIMNRNAIISLAMLYALWQSNRQDLLDLIRPFILFAVGKTADIGSSIDIVKVREYMESEFGYRSFQAAVVNRVLSREASSKVKGNRIIEKKNGQFFLKESLSAHIDSFSDKRTHCKEHSDAVTLALTNYLNENRACRRENHTQDESEKLLLSFFERQGSAIVLSVEDLQQITSKNNEADYFVARFILTEYEKKSFLFDYLTELVKGYFITTALFLQAENPNITVASFKNVTFFLDTRVLLGYLGYKSKEENDSVQEMVRSLQKNGAKLACFPYNIDELNSILEAYKMSKINKSRKPSSYTLEYFDEYGSSYTHVEAAQKKFEQRLKDGGISCVTPEQVIEENRISEQIIGLLDDERVKEILLKIKPNYNTATLPDDLTAINIVSRLRKGKKFPYIENCKAVFVTTNFTLVSTVSNYLKEVANDPGFPIAITSEDLCVMAWLKDFEQNNNLPQMRLLENVLAAITPTRELMDSYFSHLDNLENQGKIAPDEVALLRVDLYAKRRLMELTYGEKDNLNFEIIEDIRKGIREDGYKQGKQEMEALQKKQNQELRNRACRQAENEVTEEFKKKEKRWIRACKIISLIVAGVFIVASVIAFYNSFSNTSVWTLVIISIVTTIQGAEPFFSKDNCLIKLCKNTLGRKKLKETDKRKKAYLSLVQIPDKS